MIYKALAGLCALLTFGSLQAQPQAWRSVGPDNYGGRIRALAFNPEGTKLFAGAAGGGLWITTNQGQSWKPVDAYNVTAKGNQGITSIATAGNTLYVATGPMMYHKDEFGSPYQVLSNQQTQFPFLNTDGFLGDAEKPGAGVYVSTDGGTTWSNANATAPNGDVTSPYIAIQRVIVAGNRIFVATWKGLFYSDDNLATMVGVSGGDVATQPVYDVEAGADGIVMAGTAEKLFRSTDNGATFTEVPPTTVGAASSALFAGSSVNIAISAHNRSTIYVTGVKASGTIGGVYGSTDNGVTWKTIAPPETNTFAPLASNIGSYACMFDVSPFDEKNLFLAGNNWYSYSEANGWVQTAQHTSPNAFVQFGGRPYLPTSIFCLAYHPTNANMYFVGTEEGVYYTMDAGYQFNDRSAGLEASIVFAVNTTAQDTIGGGLKGVYASLPDHGLVLNGGYDKDSDIPGLANSQAFGVLTAVNTNSDDGRAKGMIATSVTHPGSIMIQNTDYGLVRSLDFGATFGTFYGVPATKDSLLGLSKINTGYLSIIDRLSSTNEGGSLYASYRPEKNGSVQVIPYVLEEQLPDSVISDSIYYVVNAISGRDSLVSNLGWAKFGTDPTTADLKYEKEILNKIDAYLFFCTKDYIWRVDNPFNNPPAQLPRWTRLTDDLTASGEFFTAITAAGDANHSVYVGTNRGNVWRIKGAHDFSTYNATTNVEQLNVAADPAIGVSIDFMTGYSVSDIAVDPTNPARVAISYTGGNPQQGTSTNFGYLWVSDSMLTSPLVPQFRFVDLTDENGLPVTTTMPINTIEWVSDPTSGASPMLFIGTDSALYKIQDDLLPDDVANFYVSADITLELGSSTPGFGAIPVTDIHVQRHKTVILSTETGNYTAMADNTLYIATYGRGVWINDKYASVNRPGASTPEAPVAASSAWVYPNPAVSGTTLRLNLVEETPATVTLFDITGKACATLANTTLAAGKHVIEVPSTKLVPGLYLIQVQAGSYQQTLKMVVAQ